MILFKIKTGEPTHEKQTLPGNFNPAFLMKHPIFEDKCPTLSKWGMGHQTVMSSLSVNLFAEHVDLIIIWVMSL